MQKGDFVKINYIGKLESGEIFDLTYEDIARKNNIFNPRIKYKPVVVVLGAGFIIKGLDIALENMSEGEKKTITVDPKDGFGERDPSLLRVMPRKYFKDPEQGKIVEVEGALGRIQSVTAGRVRIDFNNPLAGKKLVYEIEVIEKIANPEKQVSSILEFFGVDSTGISIEGEKVSVECRNISSALKERSSKIIIENVKTEPPIKKVRFLEEFS